MSLLCTILMLALPIWAIWFWFNFKTYASSTIVAAHGQLQIETIEFWQVLASALYSIAATLVISYALSQLKRLFNNFKQGSFFTDESVSSMHRFCKALFASAVLKVLTVPILSVLLTLNNGPNQKALIVNLGSDDFWLMFIATTFLAITWSFKEGLKLADENASFV